MEIILWRIYAVYYQKILFKWNKMKNFTQFVCPENSLICMPREPKILSHGGAVNKGYVNMNGLTLNLGSATLNLGSSTSSDWTRIMFCLCTRSKLFPLGPSFNFGFIVCFVRFGPPQLLKPLFLLKCCDVGWGHLRSCNAGWIQLEVIIGLCFGVPAVFAPCFHCSPSPNNNIMLILIATV